MNKNIHGVQHQDDGSVRNSALSAAAREIDIQGPKYNASQCYNQQFYQMFIVNQ